VPDRDDTLRYVAALPRRELRRALRRPDAFEPPLRILAEDVLGQDASIDFVAVDPDGSVVLVLIGEEGDDAALLTQALAQRSWVRARLRDWLQLSPGLALSASAPVRVALLCPYFSPATRAAAAGLGPDVVELSTCRCVRDGARGTAVLLERLAEPGDRVQRDERASAGGTPPATPRTTEVPRFRTGLSEDDLGLTADEIREFE
jgi:hypothetical protein